MFTIIYLKQTISRVYSVATVLYLQSVLHRYVISHVECVLYCHSSSYRRTCAESSTAVFCISLIYCFPGMLFRYFLIGFEIVPVAPVITDITFAFTFHVRWISFIRSLYLTILLASFLITCLYTENATSINIHVPFAKSRIMISGLLLGTFLFVCSCCFHNAFTYLHDLFRLILVHGHTSVHSLILPPFPCVC